MERAKIVELTNLCPHDIVIFGSDSGPANAKVFPRAATPARAAERVGSECYQSTQLGDILVGQMEYAEVYNLPVPNWSKGYIVSFITIVAARNFGRPIWDLYYPGDLVRDEAGEIIGSRSLYQWSA